MARLRLTTVALAVLLVSACITFGYLALLHTDALPVPTADGTADGTKASQRLKRLLSQRSSANWRRLNASVERTTASLYESSRWAKAQLLRAADPCAGLELADGDEACEAWAKAGECEANPDFMLQRCELSCHSCRRGAAATHPEWDSCKDQSSYCGQWAAVGECDSNPHYMRHMCRVTCHLCQSRACHDADAARCKAEAEAGVCHAAPERMYRECRWRSLLKALQKDPTGGAHCPGLLGRTLLAPGCATRSEPLRRCTAQGPHRRLRCGVPGQSATESAPPRHPGWACRWCAMSTNALCVRDKHQTPAMVPGTLEHMFARAVGEEHARFSPRVLSRQPWVVSFDSFLSEEEQQVGSGRTAALSCCSSRAALSCWRRSLLPRPPRTHGFGAGSSLVITPRPGSSTHSRGLQRTPEERLSLSRPRPMAAWGAEVSPCLS